MTNHSKTMLYKNLTITKISDHGGTEKTPTHALVVTDEKFQNKKTVGKLWTKTGEYGKFLTGSMSDDFTKTDGTFFSGYRIISLEEYNQLTGGATVDTEGSHYQQTNWSSTNKLTGQAAEDNKRRIDEINAQYQKDLDEGKAMVDDIPFN